MKWTSKDWSSAGYLLNSRGPFSGIFQWVASTNWALEFTDALVIWGLTLIGLLLILGLFSNWAAAAAGVFLLLVYFSNPPWPGVNAIPGEGSFLIVNKNLVELGAALILFFFPSYQLAGLDSLLSPWLDRSPKGAQIHGR